MSFETDTLAAIATPPGLGGLCVIRISGPEAFAIGDRLVGGSVEKPSKRPANTFFYASVLHPRTHEKIDDAIFLIFRAPHSFTGEDTLEIQGHGGRLPPARILEAVLAAGAKLAPPGGFSQRAFLNGRLDLTQAEAICDFIHAKSERAAKLARAQLDGDLGQEINTVYDQLLATSADVEHILDFDEDEVPDTFIPEIIDRISSTCRTLSRLIESWHEGQIIREGALIVLSGKPNAGKSSLMNTLLRRNRAIVNDQPGTTRDVIEEAFSLEGISLRLMDTAGLRETGNAVEQEGITRAREWMARADVNIHLIDRSDPEALTPPPSLPDPGRTLIILSKSDLPNALPVPLPLPKETAAVISLSTRTGEGIETLKESMLELLGLDAGGGVPPPAVSLRHAEELRVALDQGTRAQKALNRGAEGLVLAAIHLKNSCEAVGRITGRVYTEELLDRIFSTFCVGK